VIARHAQRMSELVNDLLALSRIESGRSASGPSASSA
jgi:signal transduction histidine kinase